MKKPSKEIASVCPINAFDSSDVSKEHKITRGKDLSGKDAAVLAYFIYNVWWNLINDRTEHSVLYQAI